jgi:high affinity sulfate transporter 1
MVSIRDGVQASGEPRGRRLPAWLLQGITPIDRSRFAADLVAGATLAALSIPEVMGYTRIAGTPVVTGLYTLLIPALIYALFGSSRHLVVGADSATAAIMAAALLPIAQQASGQYMQLAGVLALGCAVLLLVARLARLAFLADFLSRTVLAGFLTGVGVQVALGELPGVLGIAAHGNDTLSKLWNTLSSLPAFHAGDALVAGAVIAFVVVARRISPKLPGALIAVVAAIAASWLFDLEGRGISVIGRLHGGLPDVGVPDFSVAREHVSALGSAAFAMAIVILAQSAATSRAYAWKYDEPYSANVDLVGLALANAGAAFTGAFVVNGSPTKTQMVDSAGGRSQVAHLTMAAIVLVVLLFLTGPIAYLPHAALSAVVLLIGLDLVHSKELRGFYGARRSEFWVAVVTAVAVVAQGVERAILLAMLLSLIDHVRRGYRPHNSVILRGPDGHAEHVTVEEGGDYAPGLLVYRFGHSMYYANADILAREVSALCEAGAQPLRWLVIDLDAVDDVDFSAGATLVGLRASLAEKGVSLKFLRPSPELLDQLRRYGLCAHEEAGASVFASLREMRHRYEGSPTGSATPSRPAEDTPEHAPGG